jgi:hypothetical protein
VYQHHTQGSGRHEFEIGDGSPVGQAVDLFAEDVAMAGVTCGLLDHVDHDPPE